MEIKPINSYNKMSKLAAEMVAEQIINKPNTVLGLATGSTPVGMYRELVRMHREGDLDLSQVKTFNLDEYLGLSPEHSQSYHYYMYENFFKYVNIREENIHIPKGNAEDPVQECLDYEKKIKGLGGIDLQILGIGVNGHVGFNEPNINLEARTHIIQLSNETITANSRFFKNLDEVPKKAITMGMATIMKSKKIILMAWGAEKKKPILKVISGPIATEVPASLLQVHNDVILIVDKKIYSFSSAINSLSYPDKI
ncbi:MAG: glucosamine-6-phosphate deaminase [Actinomycetia bacterium]|nr:glucosamine-6-phosphate deaminase [Candidatus Omnitrophota bacterium]MCG2791485.1 glucosamine-6-phosphate deaminase [Actinomycetes bacterium]